MIKDYKNWHPEKADINNKKERLFFHIREIWNCHLGENIGFEQDGVGEEFLRPAIIFKKFNNEVMWIIPLTKKTKKRNSPYYFSFSFEAGVDSYAILSQIKLIDAKRLKYKIGDISEDDFSALKTKIRQLLA